jgi:acyl-CoA thioester hydrolase
MSERPAPPAREDYGFFLDFKTRWIDNDLYGHVNNVVYYSYFDTLIAEFLIQEGGFDPHADAVVGMAVETGCRFHASLRYPDRIVAGLRVGHLGRSSVRWEIGIFNAAAGTAAAAGHFVHVFVERAGQRPVPIPERLRAAMARIRAAPSAA